MKVDKNGSKETSNLQFTGNLFVQTVEDTCPGNSIYILEESWTQLRRSTHLSALRVLRSIALLYRLLPGPSDALDRRASGTHSCGSFDW